MKYIGGPIVFNTYQCYLRDCRARMLLALRRSQEEGWILGYKAVRGAYMIQERARAAELGYVSHRFRGDIIGKGDRESEGDR